MKAKLISICFFLFLAFLFNKSWGQNYAYVPFPTSNASWNEEEWDSNSPAVFNIYAIFDEDTVINDLVYHKIFQASNTSQITRENSKLVAGIREDTEKRVWIVNFNLPYLKTYNLNDSSEVLLYDFSLQVGDTLWAKKDHANFVPVTEYMVVSQIDTILIQNSKRKVFSFGLYPWVKWIEGIGNIQGLVFPYGDLTTGGLNNKLLCMHQNDMLMYMADNETSCVPQFVVDKSLPTQASTIKVFPNPARSGVVNFENLDFEMFELFDLKGTLIRKIEIGEIRNFKFNVSELSRGIYTYQLKTKNKLPTRGKLIIQ